MPVYIVKHLFTFSWFSAPLFDTNLIYTPFCDVSICDVRLLPRYIVKNMLHVFCLVYHFVSPLKVLFICYFMQTLDFKSKPSSSYF